MYFTLTRDDHKYIKSLVKQGYYLNPAEFVRDAVRRAREESQGKKYPRAK